MAIKTSVYSRGQVQLPSPTIANHEVVEIIEHEFAEALPSADILDLFPLPPGCRITDIRVITTGTGAATMNMGLMTGEVGSTEAARTLGTDLFSAVTPTTAQTATIPSLASIKKAGDARSIGVRFSAAVPAGPGNKLIAIIRYAAT